MYQRRNVTKTYTNGRHPVPAVQDVDLEIGDGEWLAIQGRTGSGKTTLLQILGGRVRDAHRGKLRPMTDGLADRVFAACHLEGRFTLRSGEISTEYFDKYLFESDPVLLGEVAEAMEELLPPCDVLGGMEMGGIPLVTALSQRTGLPAVFVRKVAKPYGTSKAIEGISVDGLRVVAVEDVVTTAGALVAGCGHLRAAGALVDIALCAIDREQGGAAALEALGVALRSALGRTDLDLAAQHAS